ncbi:MAG: hypothetical protein HYW50_00210 [Candidatus Diapherotrites archaeon]|nr:hypothetical protein [Candidatus Diapherotrites archaeon]
MVSRELVLDTIKRMRGSGIDDQTISSTLKDIGLSDKEINEFMSEATGGGGAKKEPSIPPKYREEELEEEQKEGATEGKAEDSEVEKDLEEGEGNGERQGEEELEDEEIEEEELEPEGKEKEEEEEPIESSEFGEEEDEEIEPRKCFTLQRMQSLQSSAKGLKTCTATSARCTQKLTLLLQFQRRQLHR